MSKFKTMIKNDIAICDEYIKEGYAKYSDVKVLTGKYLIDYPDFDNGIINYAHVNGKENEIENIKIVKAKLEYLLNRVDNPDLYNNQKPTGINISTINNNNNTNSNNVTLNSTNSIKITSFKFSSFNYLFLVYIYD